MAVSLRNHYNLKSLISSLQCIVPTKYNDHALTWDSGLHEPRTWLFTEITHLYQGIDFLQNCTVHIRISFLVENKISIICSKFPPSKKYY